MSQISTMAIAASAVRVKFRKVRQSDFISLAHDKSFSARFKKYELLSLTNFGTAFGMGLIVITFMGGLKRADGTGTFWGAALIGLLGAIFGAILSTRLMQWQIRDLVVQDSHESAEDVDDDVDISFKSKGSVFLRLMNAVLDGGRSGVDLGLGIIPGVVIISTVIFLLTNDATVKDATGAVVTHVYDGSAKQGVGMLPMIAGHLNWLFELLFGFRDSKLLAFPITSLGSVGAALAIAKDTVKTGLAGGNEIAVFTAMGMCWSGYLSTHAAMLDTLGSRHLTSKAFISHTCGGVFAGIVAHWLFVLANTVGIV